MIEFLCGAYTGIAIGFGFMWVMAYRADTGDFRMVSALAILVMSLAWPGVIAWAFRRK